MAAFIWVARVPWIIILCGSEAEMSSSVDNMLINSASRSGRHSGSRNELNKVVVASIGWEMGKPTSTVPMSIFSLSLK